MAKNMSAPVTAIIGMDVRFYEMLPTLFPQADAKAWFKDLPENVLENIALRNLVSGRVLRAGGAVAGLSPDSTVRAWSRSVDCPTLAGQ